MLSLQQSASVIIAASAKVSKIPGALLHILVVAFCGSEVVFVLSVLLHVSGSGHNLQLIHLLMAQ